MHKFVPFSVYVITISYEVDFAVLTKKAANMLCC